LAGRGIEVVIVAVVTGATVWLVLFGATAAWLVVVAVSRGSLFGPRPIVRWLLSCWLSRLAALAVWGIAGWHIFCQRP
jgi:hypothetical protein